LWDKTGNPLIVLIAITSFNLAFNGRLKNAVVNYISILSMLIYLIHENLIVRNYVRPMIWKIIYEQFEGVNIVLADLIFSCGLFLVALIIGALYKQVLQKYVYLISDFLSSKISLIYSKLETVILNCK